MIPVADLDQLAVARLEDARVLAAASRYEGAAYLCGYAVEIGLKARICRTLNWSGFPSTKGEFDGYHSFKVHNLDVLLRLSGQEARIKQAHMVEWSTAAKWNPEARYRSLGSVNQADADDMVRAVGVLLGVL